MRALLLPMLFQIAVLAHAQVALAFSPVKVSRKVQKWNVSGCPGRPIAIAEIRNIASSHGINWWVKSDSLDALSRKTPLGITVMILTGGTVGAAALINSKMIKAASWEVGITAAAGFMGYVLPWVKGQAPQLDPQTDNDLSVATNGCGQTVFYSAPGGAAFTDQIAPAGREIAFSFGSPERRR